MNNKLDIIKKFFIEKRRYFPDVHLFEFGVDFCRFDLIAINAHKKRIKGFEFKVNKQDFYNDIKSDKWKKYLKYCHTFTWVCPHGLIEPYEIEKPAGLLWIWTKTIEGLDKSKEIYDYLWRKKPTSNEIKQEDFEKVLCLLINRAKYRAKEFF